MPTGQENWAALSVITHDILLYYGDIPAPHVLDTTDWSHDNEINREATQDGKIAVIYHNEGTACLSGREFSLFLLLIQIFSVLIIWTSYGYWVNGQITDVRFNEKLIK